MTFFTLPDRQVLYLLDYLRTGLNKHPYAQYLDTSSVLVDGTLARNPKRARVYKDEWVWELFPASMPYLALWRNTNDVDRSRQMEPTEASCGLGWFAEIPAGDEGWDADTWGRTHASNVWHACKHLLTEIPTTTQAKGGFDAVYLGAGEVDIDDSESVCGFIAPLTVRHLAPPYDIEDPAALAQVAVDIKLYDSSTDPSTYEGLTTEAEIEPST